MMATNNIGFQKLRDRSFSESNLNYGQDQQLLKSQPYPYASMMNLHTQHQPYGYMPMMPYHYQPQLQQQQQLLPPSQPIIMNHVAPTAAPVPTTQPTNIVINAEGGGRGHNGAAAILGGFECPFCHLGVVKRERNPLMKIFIVLVAIATFPFGILACLFCFFPCAYRSKCSTCKKTI